MPKHHELEPTMRDPVFPTICALALVLLLLVLPTHVRARNIGTLLFIGWSFISTLVFFVNSLVWAGNLSDPAPVWCDISAKILIGVSVGLSAASLCINRKLYQITHPKYAYGDSNSKRRTAMFDLGIGLGLPVLVMVLHTVVQGHRYDIIEDVGCYPTTYTTLLAIPMVFMWPVLIHCVGLFYSFFTIRELVNRRRQFSNMLSTTRSGLNTSQYLRLMALAATEMVLSLPLSLYVLISFIMTPQNPWISWADTHQGFGNITFEAWESVELNPPFMVILQFTRYSAPILAIVFFLYFGIAGEATAEYRRWYWTIAGRFGVKKQAGSGYSGWTNRLASNSSTAPHNVSFPSARPTMDTTRYPSHSLDRVTKNDVESQLQSRDTLDLHSLNRSGDLAEPKPAEHK
ncbi:STE3-like pheromone receptor, partial [Rhizoctonia solani]